METKQSSSALTTSDVVASLANEMLEEAAKDVPSMDVFRPRVDALSEVDRLRLWGQLSATNMALPVLKHIHRIMGPIVLNVFKVPMGAAGIGVTPTVSPELDAFYGQVDPYWPSRKQSFNMDERAADEPHRK